MSALADIVAAVEKFRKDNERVFFCHPSDLERVREVTARIRDWPEYWEIRESPFVDAGQIVMLDPHGLEKSITEYRERNDPHACVEMLRLSEISVEPRPSVPFLKFTE